MAFMDSGLDLCLNTNETLVFVEKWGNIIDLMLCAPYWLIRYPQISLLICQLKTKKTDKINICPDKMYDYNAKNVAF